MFAYFKYCLIISWTPFPLTEVNTLSVCHSSPAYNNILHIYDKFFFTYLGNYFMDHIKYYYEQNKNKCNKTII